MRYPTVRQSVAVLLLTPLLLFVSACEKDGDIGHEVTSTGIEDEEINTVQINALVRDVTSNLSDGLASMEVRAMVKALALQRFDGDENFLIATSLDAPIVPGTSEVRTFQDLLEGKSSLTGRSDRQLVSSLLKTYPLAQISIYVPSGRVLEDWEASSRPVVAYVPVDFEETKDKQLPAFDEFGEASLISAVEAPEDVTIVVTENERVTSFVRDNYAEESWSTIDDVPVLFAQGQVSYSLKSELLQAENELTLAALAPGKGGGVGPVGPVSPGGGSGGLDHDCDRDEEDHKKDYITRFRFDSESDYKDCKDGWFNNDLEIRCDIVFATANGAIASLKKDFSLKQKVAKKIEWIDRDLDVLTWAEATYGDAMKYAWHEEDGGGSVEQVITLSTEFENGTSTENKTTITVDRKRVDLGESLPQHCDDVGGDGYDYNTGGVRFTISLED